MFSEPYLRFSDRVLGTSASIAPALISKTKRILIATGLVLRAIKRADVQILAPILGQIRILKPAVNRLLAYETWLLEVVDGKTKQMPR